MVESNKNRSGLGRLPGPAQSRPCNDARRFLMTDGRHARYAPDGQAAAEAEYTARYPAYLTAPPVDELRAADYARLDRLGHIYLDYTGGGLYADGQVRRHHDLLAENVF